MSLYHRYHPTIWIRVVGTVLSKVCEFMLKAFLGVYLFEKLNHNLVTSAFIVTLGPIAALFFSFYAGLFSDRVGRKPIMVFSLFMQAINILGYIWATEVWHFVLLSIFSGVSSSLFWPAANAQIADLVSEERRGEAYALMHSAINVGAAVGPLLGVYFYRHSASSAFIFCSLGLVVYAALLFFFTEETVPPQTQIEREVTKHAFQFKNWADHKVIFALTLFSIPVGLLYSQVDMILPQQLKLHFSDYLFVFGLTISLNGAVVTLLQIPIQKMSERFSISKVVLTAFVFFALTAFGYGFASSVFLLLTAEIFFTLGEMLNGPQIQRIVAHIAPIHLRGSYFAIITQSWSIAGIIGPNLGAWIMTRWSGPVWFLILSSLILVAGIAQFRLVRRIEAV